MKHINAISVDIVVDSDQGIRARKLSVGDDPRIESIGAFRDRVRKTLDEMTGASETRAALDSTWLLNEELDTAEAPFTDDSGSMYGLDDAAPLIPRAIAELRTRRAEPDWKALAQALLDELSGWDENINVDQNLMRRAREAGLKPKW